MFRAAAILSGHDSSISTEPAAWRAFVDLRYAGGRGWNLPGYNRRTVRATHSHRTVQASAILKNKAPQAMRGFDGTCAEGRYRTVPISWALQLLEKWRARRDSNSRPPGSKLHDSEVTCCFYYQPPERRLRNLPYLAAQCWTRFRKSPACQLCHRTRLSAGS